MATMLMANTTLLVMDSDPDEGFVRGRWKGHDMPTGRGFFMSTAESGKYVQVGMGFGGSGKCVNLATA